MIIITWQHGSEQYSENWVKYYLLPVGTMITVTKYDIVFVLKVANISAQIDADSKHTFINCDVLYTA